MTTLFDLMPLIDNMIIEAEMTIEHGSNRERDQFGLHLSTNEHSTGFGCFQMPCSQAELQVRIINSREAIAAIIGDIVVF